MHLVSGSKVGRQRIPREYLMREESLRRAAIEPVSKEVTLSHGRVDVSTLNDLRSAIDDRHESPSLSTYVDKNSLPYSTSLRSLALKSVANLSRQTKQPADTDPKTSLIAPSYFHRRNNSLLI